MSSRSGSYIIPPKCGSKFILYVLYVDNIMLFSPKQKSFSKVVDDVLKSFKIR